LGWRRRKLQKAADFSTATASWIALIRW
jgi:hypothetical protein